MTADDIMVFYTWELNRAHHAMSKPCTCLLRDVQRYCPGHHLLSASGAASCMDQESLRPGRAFRLMRDPRA